jgi:hypothetical protein
MTEHSPNEPQVQAPAPKKTGGIRRWLAGGLVGVVLGALLLGGTAFAQTDSNGNDLRQSFIDRLADKLGIASDDLESAITDTQVEMIDEAVTEGRLTDRQADVLRERAESGEGLFGMRPVLGMHPMHALDINLATIASELGITTDELRAELQSGSALSEVITAHGSTIDAVVKALVANAETELNEAVANGNLTQAQADQILTNLPDRLTQMIENGFPGLRGPWFNNDRDQNQDRTATPESSDDADETSNQV